MTSHEDKSKSTSTTEVLPTCIAVCLAGARHVWGIGTSVLVLEKWAESEIPREYMRVVVEFLKFDQVFFHF